jgi:hypothetical protein
MIRTYIIMIIISQCWIFVLTETKTKTSRQTRFRNSEKLSSQDSITILRSSLWNTKELSQFKIYFNTLRKGLNDNKMQQWKKTFSGNLELVTYVSQSEELTCKSETRNTSITPLADPFGFFCSITLIRLYSPVFLVKKIAKIVFLIFQSSSSSCFFRVHTKIIVYLFKETFLKYWNCIFKHAVELQWCSFYFKNLIRFEISIVSILRIILHFSRKMW